MVQRAVRMKVALPITLPRPRPEVRQGIDVAAVVPDALTVMSSMLAILRHRLKPRGHGPQHAPRARAVAETLGARASRGRRLEAVEHHLAPDHDNQRVMIDK